jgi:nucleoside-diphosphate-sugar epimerase
MATIAFVTGGSGFVGRNLIAALRARGYSVRALARSDSAAEQVRRAGAEPVRGDLEDEAALRRGMAGCDVVFYRGVVDQCASSERCTLPIALRGNAARKRTCRGHL